MVVIAFISDPPLIDKILKHLHLPTADPPRAPARLRIDEQVQIFDEEFIEDDCHEPC